MVVFNEKVFICSKKAKRPTAFAVSLLLVSIISRLRLSGLLRSSQMLCIRRSQ